MPVRFQSLRSGSSGNCLMLWTRETRILVDFGIPTQRRGLEVLEEGAGDPRSIDAVVVTHAHGDHIRYDSLRVLERLGIPLYVHRASIPQVSRRHRVDGCPGVEIRPFTDSPFRVGDFCFEPVRVPHHPDTLTHGFVVRTARGPERKIVVMTDFHDYSGLVDHFTDADFIFVEANHDPDLLRRHMNPMSRFHMENSKAGWLLSHAFDKSRTPPAVVMLGHLSEERNDPDLARETVEGILGRRDLGLPCEVLTAPRYGLSREVRI
jgi:phosphoribosyl 1,2-cyclic phosphodiesterase